MKIPFWISVFTIALLIFCGLCWLDMRPDPTLHDGAQAGNFKLIRQQLHDGSDINGMNADGLTPLMLAVQAGHLATVDLLLSLGADVDKTGKGGNTAMHFASVLSDSAIADRLISAGADIGILNTEKVSPLCLAVQSNSPVVERLVAAGALTSDISCAGENYLFCAARAGNLTMLKILIERGTDLNLRAENGACVLHYAIIRDHKDTVFLLLEHGVNCNVQDRYGLTPLHYAVRGNQTGMVQLLLKNNAKTELRDDQHRTPLLMAAQQGAVEIFEILVRNGADINAKLPSGEDAGKLAAANHHPGIISFLADYRKELRERFGNSAAMY